MLLDNFCIIVIVREPGSKDATSEVYGPATSAKLVLSHVTNRIYGG